MFVRLQPSECKIIETYRFSHEIGERRVEYRRGDGEISLIYRYDADACQDLKPGDEKSGAQTAKPSKGRRAKTGFTRLIILVWLGLSSCPQEISKNRSIG